MVKIIFAFFLIANCGFYSFAQTQSSKQTGFSDEEYKVWSEIWCSLDNYLVDVPLKVIHIETVPMTISFEKDRMFIPKIRDYYAKAKLSDATNDLIQDLNGKNDKSYLLERKFVGCKNYVLITETDRSNIFNSSTDGWKEFKAKYPQSHGYERFSRIGLSPDKKQAVIFLQNSCGLLCGSGDLYFLVKEDDEWIEKITQNLWRS